MNGLPYYKRYPRDFIEGTIGMPFELKATYSVILDLIYMQGGNLPDDPRYISGLLGCSVRKWNSLRDGLLSLGKIQASEGYLTNYRADSELESLAKLQDKQRENRSRPNKSKDLQSPRSDHTEPEPEPKSPVAKATDAGGVVDLSEVLWTRGVAYLVRNGVKERGARSMIGKWRSKSGDRAVVDAIAAASRAGSTDPVAYITKALVPADDQKLDAWGIADAQPVRIEPRIADQHAEPAAGAADMPRVQPPAEGPEGEMSLGDANGGWAGDSLPPLRALSGCVL